MVVSIRAGQEKRSQIKVLSSTINVRGAVNHCYFIGSRAAATATQRGFYRICKTILRGGSFSSSHTDTHQTGDRDNGERFDEIGCH